MTKTRTEAETMSKIDIPAERLFGAQTQRSFENFRISNEKMPMRIIHALGMIKDAAAQTNAEMDKLDRNLADAISPSLSTQAPSGGTKAVTPCS